MALRPNLNTSDCFSAGNADSKAASAAQFELGPFRQSQQPNNQSKYANRGPSPFLIFSAQA